jgi:hypothetical protein
MTDCRIASHTNAASAVTQLPHRASLIGLPQELQDAVVSQLRRDTSKRDLLNLTRSCKALRATCLPFIYERISWLDKQEKEFFRALSSSNAKPGRYVRKLVFFDLDPAVSIVRDILEQTTNLLSLCCYFDLPYDPDSEDRINMDTMSMSLGHVSQTLTTLTIGYSEWEPAWGSPAPTLGVVKLGHMSTLKMLNILISVLLDLHVESTAEFKDVLPCSLVHLAIGREQQRPSWEYDWTPHHMLKKLAIFFDNGMWRYGTPSLQTIHIREAAWYARKDRDLNSCNVAARRVVQNAGLQYDPHPHH